VGVSFGPLYRCGHCHYGVQKGHKLHLRVQLKPSLVLLGCPLIHLEVDLGCCGVLVHRCCSVPVPVPVHACTITLGLHDPLPSLLVNMAQAVLCLLCYSRLCLPHTVLTSG
jgi:hypothetical protein